MILSYDSRIDFDLEISYPANRVYLELCDIPLSEPFNVRALGIACRLSDEEVTQALADLRDRGYLPRKDSEAPLAAAAENRYPDLK